MGVYNPEWNGIELVALIPGWPAQFLKNAKRYGSEIYLSQVNDESDLRFAKSQSFAGIMTDRIEVIAPLNP